MNVEEKMKMVCEAWSAAVTALSIKIQQPYVIYTANGIEISCLAYLPDFGGPKGMVMFLYSLGSSEIDKARKSAAESQGLFYSFISDEFYKRYDEKEFKEALADWGYFGNEDHRPGWLSRPGKK
jgi:hypothetical protein